METIVQFGPQRRLVGVLSGGPEGGGPTLLLPNAGLLPRAGPFRLHVELARRLAPSGIRTFRFEAPGVGEAPRIAGWGTREATLAAIDVLATRYGCDRFVVGGICSASDAGWNAALEDDRVSGVLMLDGLIFNGPWFQFARLANVLRRPAREWLGILWRLLSRMREKSTPDMTHYREWPTRDEAKHQFSTLLARDVRSLWIYTGGYGSHFLHPRQFAWSFGDCVRDDRVAMYYWPDCDHVFYARSHRDRLLATVEDWLTAVPVPLEQPGTLPRRAPLRPGVTSEGCFSASDGRPLPLPAKGHPVP